MGLVSISRPPPSPALRKPSPTLPLLSLLHTRRRRLAPIRSLTPCPSSIGRVTRVSSKCFSANANIDVDTGVDVKQATTEHGDSEDRPSISPGRSIPMVHLKSNIIGTDSVNLLERNYADELLTALPVLTEEQQDELAATPAHTVGLYALYVSVLVGNFVEQLWNFAWPAAVALIHPSLLPVAVVSFFTKLTTFIAGPLVGNVIDSVPRIPAYNCLNLIQAGAQLLSAIMIIFALRATRYASASTVLLQPWFIVLVGAAAIERLSGLAFGVMVERDWVVLLAGTNRAIALAQANAMLSRVDMFCEIGGASLFGILLSKYDPITCLKFAAGLMISTLPLLILLGQLTNKLSSGVLDCPKNSQGYDEYLRKNTLQKVENIVESGLHAIRHGWMEYKNQPVLPASIAYVMLFFNIALAPGAMMTTFLTHKGVSPSIIGAFSGLCAFMGVAATFMSTTLVKKLSILRAGAAGLIFQSSLLITAVVVLWGGLHLGNITLHFFLVLVVLSRLGHMSYDVIGTQILQTGIPANKANLIGATEISIASLAEFVMLGVAIIANDVSHFGILAMLSVSSVVGATWLFCHWLTKPSDEQRRLFSHGP